MGYFTEAVKSIAILSMVLVLHGLVLWQVLRQVPQQSIASPSQPLRVNFIILPPVPVVPTPKTYSSRSVPITSIVKPISKLNNINQKIRIKTPRKAHHKKYQKPKVHHSYKNQQIVQKKKNNTKNKKFNQKKKGKVQKFNSTKNTANPRHSKKSISPKPSNTNSRGNKKLSSQLASPPQPSNTNSRGNKKLSSQLASPPLRVTKNIDFRNDGRSQKQERVTRKGMRFQNQPRNKKTGGVTTAPLFLNGKPPYPIISRRRGEEGKILLKVKVNVQGRAVTVQIIKSSGSIRLDNAAMKHIKKGTFVPAQRNGKPVMGWKNIQFVFQLK